MLPVAKCSRGFTLLELMIVMVIIAVMTSFAIPSLRTSLYSDQLKSTARRVIGLVSEASQEAIRKQAVHTLSFDLEQNRIWLTSKKTGKVDEEKENRQKLTVPGSVSIVDIESVSGGKRSQGTTEIRFSKQGYVDKTLIHLRADDGRDMTVMLSPFLAVTRVYDSYLELGDDKVNF